MIKELKFEERSLPAERTYDNLVALYRDYQAEFDKMSDILGEKLHYAAAISETISEYEEYENKLRSNYWNLRDELGKILNSIDGMIRVLRD